MDFRNTTIEWDPFSKEITVYEGLARGQSDYLKAEGGICHHHVYSKPRDHPNVICMMMLQFHTIVVGDGIDPQVAHEQFLKIDQYRERISPDIKGASEDGPPPVTWGIVGSEAGP